MFKEGLTKKERKRAKKILDSLRKKDRKFLKKCLKPRVIVVSEGELEGSCFGPKIED